MRYLAALLLSLVLALPAGAQSAFTGPSTFTAGTVELVFASRVSAWRAACQLKRVNCAAYVVPMVAYGVLPSGHVGSYRHGDRVVLVDIRALGQPYGHLTTVHEMIHYLQFVTGQIVPGSGNYLTTCEAEAEAFELTYLLSVREGVEDPRVLQWDNVRDRYPGCGKETAP